MRAGREHDLAGLKLPQPLPRLMRGRFRQVIADPLHAGDGVMIVIAKGRRAPEDEHIFQRLQLGQRPPRPGRGRLAGDLLALKTQAAAGFGAILDEDHPPAARRRPARGHEAGRPRADDQHLRVAAHVVIIIGVGQPAGRAHTRRPADKALDPHPQPGIRKRPHEGFVVKTGRQKALEQIVDAPRVPAQAGAAILAFGHEALVKLDQGGAGIGFQPGALAQLDQGVRLFLAHREDAAWPVILKAPANECHAIGQQRRGQGVALVAGISPAIKAE